MTIEQKAKAYDKALKKISQYQVDKMGCIRIKVTNIFPELIKNEDERMRKGLITYLTDRVDKTAFKSEENDCEEWIAWLEKQKPITAEQKSTEYKLINLGLPSGTLWADRNIGANTPEESGDYFRWGETTPFTEDSEEYEFCDLGENIAGTEHDTATVILSKDFKMPTHEQQKELIKLCKWEWTTLNGVKGMKVTGPNGNSIFFPASGFRGNGDGSLNGVGSHGYYWFASAYGGNTFNACNLYFNSGYWSWGSNYRTNGLPVRAISQKKLIQSWQK